jgi:hypothetical protein
MLFATATGDPLLDWLVNNASAIGVLSFLVIAFIRGWIVTGREHDRVLDERDRALELVYTQAQATSRALDVAETKVKAS